MSYYNYTHTEHQEAPVSKDVVIWNFLDFPHAPIVHKRSYKYCKILAKYGPVTFVEFGANNGLTRFLPITIKHLMWHQFIPPDTILHLSKSSFGTYLKVVAKVTEFKRDDQVYTKITHTFNMHIPFFLLPFKSIITRYLKRWSKILWEEDLAMCLRRQKVLDAGFKDSPLETMPYGKEGVLVNETTHY